MKKKPPVSAASAVDRQLTDLRKQLEEEKKQEVVLENAAVLKVTDKGILVNAMFEPPRLIPNAAVSGIDFLENLVTVVQSGEKH